MGITDGSCISSNMADRDDPRFAIDEEMRDYMDRLDVSFPGQVKIKDS
jgi:hypothetical protein